MFKRGDWVKCTDPTNAAIYGRVGQVMHNIGDLYRVTFGPTPADDWHIRQSMLTLTPPPVPSKEDRIDVVKFFNNTPVYMPNKQEKSDAGVKHDGGKRQWWFMWQFLPELEQVTDILEYGNKKYPADDGSNWRRVQDAKNRYSSAIMRHWSAWLTGEKTDPETGKSHLAHMITSILFLMWFERSKDGKDKKGTE